MDKRDNGPRLQNIPIRTELSERLRQAFTPEIPPEFVFHDFADIERRVIAQHLPELEAALERSRRRNVEWMAALRNRSVMRRKRKYVLPHDRLVRLKLCHAILEFEKGCDTGESDIIAWRADHAVETEIHCMHRRLL